MKAYDTVLMVNYLWDAAQRFRENTIIDISWRETGLKVPVMFVKIRNLFLIKEFENKIDYFFILYSIVLIMLYICKALF